VHLVLQNINILQFTFIICISIQLSIQVDADGSWYDGEFRHGSWHGSGKRTLGEGDFYDGEWQNGVRQGIGSYIYGHGTMVEISRYERGQAVGEGVTFSKWDKSTRSYTIATRVRNLVEDCGGYLKAKGVETLGHVSLKEAADIVHRLGGKMPDGPTHDVLSPLEFMAQRLQEADPSCLEHQERMERYRNRQGSNNA
jgi:hypothetical protein